MDIFLATVVAAAASFVVCGPAVPAGRKPGHWNSLWWWWLLWPPLLYLWICCDRTLSCFSCFSRSSWKVVDVNTSVSVSLAAVVLLLLVVVVVALGGPCRATRHTSCYTDPPDNSLFSFLVVSCAEIQDC